MSLKALSARFSSILNEGSVLQFFVPSLLLAYTCLYSSSRTKFMQVVHAAGETSSMPGRTAATSNILMRCSSNTALSARTASGLCRVSIEHVSPTL